MTEPDFNLKSYNWPEYLRQMIARTNLDAFDRGELHLIADALEKLGRDETKGLVGEQADNGLAASEYSEFWEKHQRDFDQFGNYLPYSQIDGDLRAAKAEIERLRAALSHS